MHTLLTKRQNNRRQARFLLCPQIKRENINEDTALVLVFIENQESRSHIKRRWLGLGKFRLWMKGRSVLLQCRPGGPGCKSTSTIRFVSDHLALETTKTVCFFLKVTHHTRVLFVWVHDDSRNISVDLYELGGDVMKITLYDFILQEPFFWYPI